MKMAGHVSVEETEMVGILETLLWLSEFSEHEVVVESDFLLCVNAVNKPKHNHLEMGDLVE